MNRFAKLAVLCNLALGLPPGNHLKYPTEFRGLKITLAALKAEGFVAVDGGTVRLTPAGERKVSSAVYRLQHRAAAQAAILSTNLE